MEFFYDLVGRLVDAFGEAKLDYVFTGALAASFYGVPRTTTDVDVMVEIAGGDARGKLVSALKQAGLVAGEREVDKALKSEYMIATFKDSKTSYTVDVIFSRNELNKRAGMIGGKQTFFQTPEDLILAKLRMIKATVQKERASKDEEDIKAILKFTKVDIAAVREKAKRHSTISVLENIQAMK